MPYYGDRTWNFAIMLFIWQNTCTHVHTLSVDLHRAGGLVAKFCSTLVSQWTVACQALCPWDFPGKKTGVICHFLLQGIFPTQGLNLGLLHCRQILYWLSYQECLPNVRKNSKGLTHFIFTICLWGKYHYCCHYKHRVLRQEESKLMKVIYQNNNLNPGSLMPEST